MSESSNPVTSDDQMRQRVIRRVAWRLLPFLMLLYFINYLDRTNIGLPRHTA